MVSPWETLGIEPTADEGVIRRAYAARAKQWRPDSHPKEFVGLREAYEVALASVRRPSGAGPGPDRQTSALPPREAPTVASQPEAELEARPYAEAQTLIDALGKVYSEAGEREAVSLLYVQYRGLETRTIDARVEWELVLLHSLLTAETPPVALLFEADRLLRWRERHADVEQMFGQDGVQRLNLLLDMAWEAMYARHFSPNRWHGRLFGTAAPAWFGMMSQVVAARHTVAYWKQVTQSAGVERLQDMMSPVTQHRIDGALLLSTDVVLALVAGWVTWLVVHDPMVTGSGAWAVAWGSAVFALALPGPWIARRLQRTRVAAAMRKGGDAVPGMLWFIVGAVLFGMGVIMVAGEAPSHVHHLGLVPLVGTLGSAALLTCMAIWICLAAAEVLLARPWLAVQRIRGLHVFFRIRDYQDAPTWREQLRHVPATAWGEWKGARAVRRQQAASHKARPFASAGGTIRWWWIVGALFLVQLVGQLGK